jgi:hypothetical protein
MTSREFWSSQNIVITHPAASSSKRQLTHTGFLDNVEPCRSTNIAVVIVPSLLSLVERFRASYRFLSGFPFLHSSHFLRQHACLHALRPGDSGMCHQQKNTPGLRKSLIVRGLVACLLLIGILAPLAMHAQLNETGTITGAVTDLTGAVVPGAAVTITNVGTGVVTPVKTNGSGEFSQPGLNVGNYSVSVTMTGFNTYEQNNFYLAPTSVYAVKVILKPGDATDKIEVQSDAVHPEVSTNEISTEISGQEADMLALNGRNYQDLATIMPGVTNLSAGSAMTTGGYNFQNVISVNGMGRTSVFYTLDGIWNQELGDLLTNTVTPDPESIDQVKLLQNNYSVQYNMLGGAVMMVHTKEGTSQFHGQAWYFYRNEALNALNWFVGPGVNPTFNWKIGGIGMGGPLFIPHLYEAGRNKTFYYVNVQYVNELTYKIFSAQAPTQDEINGIFPAQTFSPYTHNAYPHSLGGPDGTQWTIPQSDIVPQAQALLRAFIPPAPYIILTPTTVLNSTLTNCTAVPNEDAVCLSGGNYVNSNPQLLKQLDTMGKIDHQINDRLRLTGEYMREGVKNHLNSAQSISSYYPGNQDLYYNNDSVAQIHLIQQLSNTMLNQTSIAMDRYVVEHTFAGMRFVNQVPNYSESLPYPSAITGLPGQWLPDISFSSGWTPFGTNSRDTQWRTAYLAEMLTDNWTWLRGKHSFAAGGTFIRGSSRLNAEADNTSGTFNFNGDATGGDPIADFLTGFAQTYSQGSNVVRKHLTYPIYSPYAEDQWKILPKLTLTLGVRYNYMPFANAAQGYATAFDPSAFNPANAPSLVDSSGNITPGSSWNPVNGYIYNGYNGVPLNISSAHKNYVSPSVGFAWDLFGNGRTSIRGGYSINYLKSGSSSDCEANCVGLPAVRETELANATFPNPLSSKVITNQFTAISAYGEDRANIQAARIHSYSASVEQQFGPNWILSIAGAGIMGRNLPLELNINQPLPVPGYAYPYQITATGADTAQYAPYKGYTTILYATSSGIANWNALEVNLRHPVGHNVILRTSFTWAHGLSDVPGQAGYAQENSGVQDSYHPMANYGSSPLNQDLNFSSDVIYILPWFHTTNWTRTAFGGWNFSAIVSLQSGLSMTPGISTSDPGLATRPNIVPTVVYQRYHGDKFTHDKLPNGTVVGVGPFFTTSYFTSPPTESALDSCGCFGNAPVGGIRGPGTIINNVALFKIFPIKTTRIRVRASLFNMMNHPNFNAVNLSENTSSLQWGDYTGAADPREAEFALEYLW